MTYVALLYSPSLDRFETDCMSCIYTAYDLAEWIGKIAEYYNYKNEAYDFYIVSITKIGDN